ncbi:MAG: hypothetical protein IIC59_07305, partial [Proteobacteria bacterium]|nr:hypothetical protein [Pseudomonadota bacterium]
MAINAFRTALEIDPANTRAMGMLGWLLAMQEFKWKDGVALMKKSVALNPNDGLVQALYGWLLFHTGQPEAVSVIEKAYRLDPLDPDVIFIKSALLTWLGQRLDAMTLQATLLLHDQEGYRSNVLVALAFAYNRPILAEERLVRARKVAGANEPFIKLLETMIALGRGDTKRFEELRAEVFDLAQHTPLQFLGNIPWTKDQIVDIWNIRVNHRQVDLLVGIFRQKPRLMSEADWNRIKILTRRDEADIGRGVFAALERTADEQEILRSLAKQPSEKHRQMYVGLYKDEQSGRTARLEWNNSELIVHYPESDITRRLIPQGDHQFKRLDLKQTFEFEVVDDQVTQFVRDFDFALLVP